MKQASFRAFPVIAATALAVLSTLAPPAYADLSYTGTPRIDRTNALVLTGLGCAALLTRTLVDHDRTQRAIDGSFLDVPIDVADVYGAGEVMGLATTGLIALGAATGSQRLSRAGTELTASLVGAWAVTWALKLGINAERPNGGAYSFPSGHTATAFAAAPVVHRNFGPIAGSAAYGVAMLTALARMEDDKHYLADVLVGAAIGIVAGRTFREWNSLQWIIPRGGTGVGLSLGF